MKLKIFITSLLLYCVGSFAYNAYACGERWFPPADYYMTRIYNKQEAQSKTLMYKRTNCLLWKKICGKGVTLEDIESVVYRYTLEQLENLPDQSSNTYVNWLKSDKSAGARELIMIIRMNEKVLSELNSRWYYPSGKNEFDSTLQNVINIAKEYKGTKLKDRYGLQYVKALFARGEYHEVIDYWEHTGKRLPGSMIKDWIFDYVCGSWFRCGQYENAMQGYGKRGDIWSLDFCARRLNKDYRSSDYSKVIADYAPDSEDLAEYLHNVCSNLESYENKYRFINEDKKEFLARFEKNCIYGAKRSKGHNKAIWYYAAAFAANLDGRPHDAANTLKLAKNVPASQYMKESLRVLDMMVDAQIAPLDTRFEKKLLDDLKWLDDKILTNLNPEVEKTTRYDGMYRIKYSLSYYYWNDMMRKLLAGYVVPRMVSHGKTVRALELLNYADNRMFGVVGKIYDMPLNEYRLSSTRRNNIDYSNAFFENLDTLDLDDVVRYVASLDKPGDKLSKWLKPRIYSDMNYLNDLIGTRYLRGLDYQNAAKYLELVSDEYENSLNTAAYMKRNPFDACRNYDSKPKQYKYGFAKKMLEWEKAMLSSDPDVSGKAMFDYGSAMEASFTRCWFLTQYSWSIFDYTYYDKDWKKEVLDKAKKYRVDGSVKVESPEVALEIYNKMGGSIWIARKYPNTAIGKIMGRMCDSWSDYVAN